MNLGQFLGEQSLRISDLEALLEGRGIVHARPASAGIDDSALKKALAAERKTVQALSTRVADLESQLQRMRARLDERPTTKDLEAAVKQAGAAAAQRESVLTADHRKAVTALEAEVERLQRLVKATAPQVSLQSPPQKRMRRSLGPNGPQAGSCSFEILNLLPAPPEGMPFATIRARLPQFKDSNISVTLHYLTTSQQLLRTGEPRHYRYSKKVAA